MNLRKGDALVHDGPTVRIVVLGKQAARAGVAADAKAQPADIRLIASSDTQKAVEVCETQAQRPAVLVAAPADILPSLRVLNDAKFSALGWLDRIELTDIRSFYLSRHGWQLLDRGTLPVTVVWFRASPCCDVISQKGFPVTSDINQ